MSTINVTNLSGRGGATPNLPDGANITGVATATSFDGNLKSTGTPTLGLGVTINASGVAISGVCTAGIVSATTLYGDGTNLTGVGESIAPWYYNPDVNDVTVPVGTGIGFTFSKKVLAGSGTATLKIVNAGVAGTTIQSWGISSVTFPSTNVENITFGSLVSDLVINQTYQLDIPEGFIVDSNETSYAGTAYTFATQGAAQVLFAWGLNDRGILGDGTTINRSSPVQIPGQIWGLFNSDGAQNGISVAAIQTDGTLWSWGYNGYGTLGQNNRTEYSSPVQIPGTTWSTVNSGYYAHIANKTDGTLWAWGYNGYGQIGNNDRISDGMSSPVQIPGTTWSDNMGSGMSCFMAIKTDGTLWTWGRGDYGQLGHNSTASYSSPVQIPGTTWRSISGGNEGAVGATKTDGTLWVWGRNSDGQLGQNSIASPANAGFSSPVQIPGTTWTSVVSSSTKYMMATKTDGTLWSWGYNQYGQLGLNDRTKYSSPTQVPGTTWPSVLDDLNNGDKYALTIKTDGTLWAWGYNEYAQLGQNNNVHYSSPVQIGSSTDWISVNTQKRTSHAILRDTTP